MNRLTHLIARLSSSAGIGAFRSSRPPPLEESPAAAKTAASVSGNDTQLSELRSMQQQLAEALQAIAIQGGGSANELNRVANQVQLLAADHGRFLAEAPLRDRLQLLHWRAISQRISRIEHASLEQGNAPAIASPAHCDLDQQFAHLRQMAPLNFDAWLGVFEAGHREYNKRDPANLSTPDHREAFLFRQFLAVHARGRVLDVGVGPLATPSYLSDMAGQQIAGIDPLPPFEPHPFAFAQSLAEFIPWPDATFETVVAATSLDHVYLLDRVLAEIRRVLVPYGRFVVWAGVFAETPPYDPYGQPITPPDAYHLFHPGENWFPGLIERYFHLIERLGAAPSPLLPGSFLAFERR